MGDVIYMDQFQEKADWSEIHRDDADDTSTIVYMNARDGSMDITMLDDWGEALNKHFTKDQTIQMVMSMIQALEDHDLLSLERKK